MSGSWQPFETYTDLASAQAIAGRLELEGVPVQLETVEAMSGIEEGFKLLVPDDFLHRARWVLARLTKTRATRSHWSRFEPLPGEQASSS